MADDWSKGPADLLLEGGWVWTGVEGQGLPYADWTVAIRAGRILAVGATEEVAALSGPSTRVVRMEGRCILPGFVDAHVHFQAGGLDLGRVDLRSVRSREDWVRAVQRKVEGTPSGAWILGGGWDEHRWGGTLPDRGWLDEISEDHPVFLLRSDLHIGLANSRALALAGIDVGTPDPDLGSIDRDPESGIPTGILRERAMERVVACIPAPSPQERERAIVAAADYALSLGVTQVHDMGAFQNPAESWASLATLQRLHAARRLPMRVRAAVPITDRARLIEKVQEEGRGDARLGWGMVKGFVDGSLGAATAWFHQPYSDLPTSAGGPISDLDELRTEIQEAVQAGFQPLVHAIGDRAVDWLLEVYLEVLEDHPGEALRLRVEHAQHLSPSAVASASSPGVVLSVQPAHMADDGAWAEGRIGAERVPRAFAFGTLQRAGARLALGSDWTVAPLDPRCALDAAVTRRILADPKGRSFGAAEERLSMDIALRAHTWGGAYAGGMEGETGTLEVGKRADLAVLSGNPFRIEGTALVDEIRNDFTFVDGDLVWSREDGVGVREAR
jgi:predicted amidohydrolase YtcJ